MKMRPGEVLVDRLESIEDTKVIYGKVLLAHPAYNPLMVKYVFWAHSSPTYPGKLGRQGPTSCDKPASHLAFCIHAQGFTL